VSERLGDRGQRDLRSGNQFVTRVEKRRHKAFVFVPVKFTNRQFGYRFVVFNRILGAASSDRIERPLPERVSLGVTILVSKTDASDSLT
jgi:hypothetical protein